MTWNLPNVLTAARIVAIPVFVVVFYLPTSWGGRVCASIFLLAALTDWLDGYLARRLQQVSPFGAFLDPVADKLMVAAALIILVEADPTPWLAVPAVVIVGREITVTALREWMAQVGERARVRVRSIGKVKTTVQMAAIVLMLYREPILGLPVYEVGVIGLYAAAVLTLWSMFAYLRAAWPSLSST
jgi:CDP-diacylglycerol--glycerol-3-phosphate 3-phosphatidyltransferase/cardiolipin synthase